jgi:DNA polymerase I-like protein with 3'-5' exonuclease and polymerase domains
MDLFTNSTVSWHDAPVALPDAFTNAKIPLFPLELPVSNKWDTSKQRMLIVLQTVDTADLRAGFLLGEVSGGAISNVVTLAHKYASICDDAISLNRCAWAAVNFNFFKTFDLDSNQRSIADAACAKRVEGLMAKLKPTHVIVLGDEAAKRIFHLPEHLNKRGWCHDYERPWGSFVGVHTIDFISCYNSVMYSGDDDDEDDEGADRDVFAQTNLAGHVARNISSIFTHGKVEDEHGLVYSAAEVQAKPVVIKTLDKLEKLADMLMESDVVAFDSELTSLNRVANTLLTLQFSVDSRRGFIVPYDHRESPFKNKLGEVKELLRPFFYNPDVDPFDTSRYLVGLNVQFDLTVVKQAFGILFLPWPVWDVGGADFVIDENIGKLDVFRVGDLNPAAFSLAAVALRYGSSAYLDKSGFNKSDRKNMGAVSLADQSFLDYGALDVQLPMAIHDCQHQFFADIGYERGAHVVLTLKSNNSHVFSSMEHRGVHLDRKYLRKQLQPGSDINRIIREVELEFHESDAVKEANKRLLEAQGVSADGGLFSDIAPEADSAWVFNLAKAEHKQVLFADVLELEPIGFGKLARPTGQPTIKIDKFFQEKHADVPEVALHTRHQKLKKLVSSYLSAFLTAIEESDDGKVDGHLRPQFGDNYVVTGRGNSRKPSLQQQPTRTKEAKYVKRMFTSGTVPINGRKRFRLKEKADFSSNEIRFWGNEAGDDKLSYNFNNARALRQQLFAATTYLYENGLTSKRSLEVIEEIAMLVKRLKREGDTHIMSIKMFFNKWVEKSDPLRDAIKALVFGTIYGMSASTLGGNIRKKQMDDAAAKIKAIKKRIQELRK